ncbi:MAG: GvpL/GvpF family gas vesicle protein, partial [Chloroflexota bacterium]
FASREAAKVAVAAHASHLAALLPRLEGAVELSVRVLPAAPLPLSPLPAEGVPATGTQYLRRRQREFAEGVRRADALNRVAGRLNQALAGVVLDSRAQVLGQRMLALACLCPRSNVAEFKHVLRGVRAAEAECRFLFSGPWAPSSFVT